MLPINKNLTTINFTKGRNSIKYIVIHYTANNGDTAHGNTVYFKSAKRNGSAHYFVDKTSIWQSVEDSNTAWHCGTTGTYYHKCRNSTSIGIEMCSIKVNGVYQIPEETVANAIELTKYLMDKYNISSENVIRHYDVTHKNCPEPFVRDISQWNSFKNRLINKQTSSSKENKHWCEDIRDELLKRSIITDKQSWSMYNDTVTKGLFMTIVDNATGGRWSSNESNPSIHWAQPSLISLCGKGIIKDKKQWEDYDTNLSKELALYVVDNSTRNSEGKDGMEPKYNGTNIKRVACLNSLCDKKIIETVSSWVNHWDDKINKSEVMALIYKAYCR